MMWSLCGGSLLWLDGCGCWWYGGRKWREGKWYENGGKKTLLTRGVDYLAGDYYFKQNIAKNNRVLKYNIARPQVLAYCQHPTSEPWDHEHIYHAWTTIILPHLPFTITHIQHSDLVVGPVGTPYLFRNIAPHQLIIPTIICDSPTKHGR